MTALGQVEEGSSTYVFSAFSALDERKALTAFFSSFGMPLKNSFRMPSFSRMSLRALGRRSMLRLFHFGSIQHNVSLQQVFGWIAIWHCPSDSPNLCDWRGVRVPQASPYTHYRISPRSERRTLQKRLDSRRLDENRDTSTVRYNRPNHGCRSYCFSHRSTSDRPCSLSPRLTTSTEYPLAAASAHH